MYSAVSGPYEYVLWISAPEEIFIARKSTLDALFEELQANAFAFGLDRHETFVRLGYRQGRDPEES